MTNQGPPFSNELLWAILDGSPIATFAIDHRHRVIVWNGAMEKMSGIGSGQMLGTNEQWRACFDTARPCLVDLLVDDSHDLREAMEKWYGRVLDRAADANDTFETVYLLPPRAGKPARWLRLRSAPIRDGSGKIVAGVETMEDVTAEQTAERALRQSEARYRVLYESSTDAIVMLDAGWRIRSCNPAFLTLFGFTAQGEVSGRSARILLGPDDDFEAFCKSCQAMTETSTISSAEWHFHRQNGSVINAEVSASARRDTKGGVVDYVVIVRDVTARRRHERRLTHWAEHDALTGLPNRRAFLELLRNAVEQAQRAGRRFAVIFMDLDHFKEINDSLGHQRGDGALLAAARRVQGLLRLSDTVARFGGDEFVILLTGISTTEQATDIAAKIVSAFRSPLEVDGQKLSLTTSAGIAVYPDHGRDREEILMNADAAMYEAKERGRDNFVCFAGASASVPGASTRSRATQEKSP